MQTCADGHWPTLTLVSGDPARIAGYLGDSDKFDKAIADFSVAYADQTERDYEVLLKAVRAGKLEVFVEETP